MPCTGVMSLAAIDVCPGSVKRAKLKEFVVKKVELLTPYYLRNLQQPSFLQDWLGKGVVFFAPFTVL